MRSNFISVPFKADKGDGLFEFNGIAKFSSAGIVIEFEKKFLGMFGSEIKEVRLGIEDILDIKFRKGFLKFFSRIQFRFSNMGKLNDLPNKGGKVSLKIKREDHGLAESAVKFFESALNPALEELPPPQTPVGELFGKPEDKYKTNELKETKKLS